MDVFYVITIVVLAIATAVAFVWGYRKGVNDGRDISQNKPLKVAERKGTKIEQTEEHKKIEGMMRWLDEYKP